MNAEGGNLYFTIIIVFNHVIHSCLQASFILYYNTNYCVDWSISNLVYEERTTSLGTEPPSLSPQEKSDKGPLTEGSLGVVRNSKGVKTCNSHMLALSDARDYSF